MPAIRDYRQSAYDFSNVKASGQNIGRTVYWKLFAIENAVRVIIGSILHAQVGKDWWTIATSDDTQRKAARNKQRYASYPWFTTQGQHEIYYLDLADYNEILRDNSHLFLPIVPNVDEWIARIEQVRLPRNVVAHMNWIHATDRQRIDLVYTDVQALERHVSAQVSMHIPH
jgi:hypothetical protein